MIPGEVKNVRELKHGVQADVCVGASGVYGYLVVTVHGRSVAVQKAMLDLKAALRDEVRDTINLAREDDTNNARELLGA